MVSYPALLSEDLTLRSQDGVWLAFPPSMSAAAKDYKSLPPPKDTPTSRDTPTSKDAPTSKVTATSRDTPTPKVTPTSRDTPIPKDTPTSRDTPTFKDSREVGSSLLCVGPSQGRQEEHETPVGSEPPEMVATQSQFLPGTLHRPPPKACIFVFVEFTHLLTLWVS